MSVGQRDTPRPARRAGLVLFAAALVHALVYLALLPPWMGEDEPWQVEYAHHIAAGHMPWGGLEMSGPVGDKPDDRTLMSLSQLQVRRRIGGLTPEEIAATQVAILDSQREHAFWNRVAFAGWGPGAETFDQVARGFTATHQPIPYYLAAGSILRALGIHEVEAQMRALRGLSVLAYLALVVLAWLFAREVSDDPWLALAAALFVAWLPMHARQAAVVNNDVLAKVLAGGAIVLGARVLRDKGGLGTALALFVLAFTALMVKTTAAAALAMAALALAWRLRGRIGRVGRGRIGRRGLAAAAATALLGGAALVFVANHSPVLPRRMSNLVHRLDLATSAELWDRLGRTFAGNAGWESRDLPDPFYLAVWIGMGAALVAALVVTVRGGDVARRRLLLVCWGLVAIQLALIALRGEGRGRYFFPVLPALATLVAAGVTGCVPARRRGQAVTALAVALVAWDAVFLWRGLALEEYARWGS